MRKEKIYVVEPQQKYTFAEALSYHEKYDYNQYEICPTCGRRISGAKWIGEKVFTVGKKRIPDFLYASGGTDLPFVVSEKAYSVLKENGIKGIVNAEKIDKILREGERLDNVFFDLSVMRCDYPIDYERSKIAFGKDDMTRKKCELCNPFGRCLDFIFSLHFSSEVEIREDIFTTYQTGGMLFLSETFIKVCAENGLTGLNYKPIHKYDSSMGIFSQSEISNMIGKKE